MKLCEKVKNLQLPKSGTRVGSKKKTQPFESSPSYIGKLKIKGG
jgi:hypothetical protein